MPGAPAARVPAVGTADAVDFKAEYPGAAMNVVSCGPWRATSLLWRPSPRAWTLTVACHALFEIAPNQSLLIAKPPPPDLGVARLVAAAFDALRCEYFVGGSVARLTLTRARRLEETGS